MRSLLLDLSVANGLVTTPEGSFSRDIGVRDGRVVGLYEPGTAPPAAEIIDATGRRVLPGFVDVHFHFNIIADGLREDVASGTAAAAAGGATTVFQMPVFEPFSIRERAQAAESQAHVDFALWAMGGATQSEVYQAVDEGAIGFKIYMITAPSSDRSKLNVGSGPAFYHAMKLCASTGRRIAVHCEDQSLIDAIQPELEAAGRRDPLAHQDSRPPAVEVAAVAKMLALAGHLGARVHLCHVTTNGVIPLVVEAKRQGIDLTAETCAHYLCFDSEIMKTAGPFARIAPPIRSAVEADGLWPALRDGVLDVVSSDHAPNILADKQRGWESIFLAPNGAPGAEIRARAVLTAAARGQLTFERAAEVLSAAGARAFDIYPRKGAIAPGSDADLVLFDPAGDWRVKAAELITRARDVAMLYEGMPMRGQIVRTIVRGRTVYLDGRVVGAPGLGRQVSPMG